MSNEIGTQLVVQAEDNDAVQEAQRVMKIKVFITIAAVLLLVLAAILFWDDEDGYAIKIATDEGQTWSYEIADTSLIANTGVSHEDGKYKCTFDGLCEGQTEITLCRTDANDLEIVFEKRVYHVQVAENLKIIQTSVDREVYE